MKSRMDLATFKGSVSKGLLLPTNTRIVKSASMKIEPAGDRRKLFTISTETVDRDNDKILLKGWDLRAYMSNPVVLWSHDSSSPPIGRALEIGIDGDALKSVVEFVPEDMPMVGQLAEMIFRMVDMGFLNACSVGMRPLEYEVAKDRTTEDDWWPAVNFLQHELCEWSICTIPANPEATIDPQERAARVEDMAIAAQREVEAKAATAAAIATHRRQLRAACF